MREITEKQLRYLRLCTQRLQPAHALEDAAQVVKAVCGIQAQDMNAAILAVRPRSHELLAEGVQKAREKDKSIVLTWAMRGTMHLISAEDVGWLMPFLAPIFIKQSNHRYKALGLDEETRHKACRIIHDALTENGAMTRAELGEVLAKQKIPVAGQAIFHLLRAAGLKSVICFGADRNGEPTYVALETWIQLDKPLGLEKVPAELARRYLEGYAPAAPNDFAKWAGMSLGQARKGFEGISKDLVELKVAHSTVYILKNQKTWLEDKHSEPLVRLLPAYDTYMLGYQNRDFMISEKHAKHIHPGGGQINPAVIVEGRAVGRWKLNKKEAAVEVDLFEKGNVNVEAEVQDIKRFLG